MAKTKQVGDFSTGMGESNLTAGSNFFKSILSGDASKQAQVLAPAISSAKTQASQDNKKNAIFGTRSGGTAAASSATDDKVHSDITNLIGNLTGSAASNLTSTGGSLLSTGLSATGQDADMSQKQMENWKSSIFGSAITGGVNYAESFLPVAHGGSES
jgi:hypothetical protein